MLAEAAPGDHRILVVDDGSPDGTGAIAERVGAELGVVEVLHRTGKGGLGQAYLAGFAHALAAGAQLRRARWTPTSRTTPPPARRCWPPPSDADVVLGSRYVPGGGVTDWGRCGG